MEVLELTLVLAISVLLSALLSQATKRISAPLIQIAIGVAISLLYGGGVLSNFHLDEELFLVLFIAPLLYNEAKNADRLMLWSNKKTIVSLAVGLVIAITLAVGFGMHWLYPSIPLAACFALGAALGPTDAVAVSSLSSVTNLTRRQKGILNGESLINDASGLVAFQFAIAAAVTGTFSVMDAGASFLFLFFGGIAIGLILGIAFTTGIAFIRSNGFENTTFHVLLDVVMPFITYLIAESFGVSGILAVVACGLVFRLAPCDAGVDVSKMNIVSNSTWRVITFALNGIVFTLLGLQLPSGLSAVLDSDGMAFALMIVAIIAITLIMIIVRFLWCLFTEITLSSFGGGERRRCDAALVKHCMILACSGAKGAITLSIAFMIPSTIAGADVLVTTASGVILLTLVIANFVVPVLAPAPSKTFSEEQQEALEFKASVLRRTIRWLASEQDDDNKLSVQTVMSEYDKRLTKLKNEGADGTGDGINVELRVQALKWEEEKCLSMIESDKIDSEAGYKYMYRLHKAMSHMQNRSDAGWAIIKGAGRFKAFCAIAYDAVIEMLGFDQIFKQNSDDTADKPGDESANKDAVAPYDALKTENGINVREDNKDALNGVINAFNEHEANIDDNSKTVALKSAAESSSNKHDGDYQETEQQDQEGNDDQATVAMKRDEIHPFLPRVASNEEIGINTVREKRLNGGKRNAYDSQNFNDITMIYSGKSELDKQREYRLNDSTDKKRMSSTHRAERRRKDRLNDSINTMSNRKKRKTIASLTDTLKKVVVNDSEIRDSDGRKGFDRRSARELIDNTKREEMKKLRAACAEYVLAHLESALYEKKYPAEDISAVMLDYHRTLRTQSSSGMSPSMTMIIKVDEGTDKVRLAALKHEIELIDEAYDNGDITRTLANAMKRNVYTMQIDIESAL